jgi:hypothetical protein
MNLNYVKKLQEQAIFQSPSALWTKLTPNVGKKINIEQCTYVRPFTFSTLCCCGCFKYDGSAQLVFQYRWNLYPISKHGALHIFVIHLFPQIRLICGLHLRDKWKWLIMWTFVFCSGAVKPRFQNIARVSRALWNVKTLLNINGFGRDWCYWKHYYYFPSPCIILRVQKWRWAHWWWSWVVGTY